MFGWMATTLTGIMVPSAWKTWVMPTLRPINPMLMSGPPSRAQPGPCQGGGRARERAHSDVRERGRAGANAGMGRISVRGFITS